METLTPRAEQYYINAKVAFDNGEVDDARDYAFESLKYLKYELDKTSLPTIERTRVLRQWDSNMELIQRIDSGDIPALKKKENDVAPETPPKIDQRYKNPCKPRKEIPDKTFADIAGMKKLKKKLEISMIYPLVNPKKILGLPNAQRSSGVLLYGPPGCGKTLYANAAAGEANKRLDTPVYFISPQGSDMRDMWEGKSLQSIRLVFEEAAANTPSYIFFDELTGIGHKKGGVSDNTSELVEELKTCYSFIEEKPVFLIGATNDPLDVATPLVRRFGGFEYIPPPDYEARLGVLKIVSKDTDLASDVDLVYLARRTEAFASSDLVEIVADAERNTLQDRVENNNMREVTMRDITKILETKQSSLGPWATEILLDQNKYRNTQFAHLIDDARRIYAVLNISEELESAPEAVPTESKFQKTRDFAAKYLNPTHWKKPFSPTQSYQSKDVVPKYRGDIR